jgi:hypothetical protein
METPYLDAAIKRHEKALEINMLSDGGKEALNEFKAIKQALRIHGIVGRSEQLVCDVCESTDDVQTYCGKCMEERC